MQVSPVFAHVTSTIGTWMNKLTGVNIMLCEEFIGTMAIHKTDELLRLVANGPLGRGVISVTEFPG